MLSLSLSLSLFLFLCLSLSRTLSEALSLLSRDKASHDQGVQFVGRLANCKYINMDEAVDYALGVTESVCRVCVCVCVCTYARASVRERACAHEIRFSRHLLIAVFFSLKPSSSSSSFSSFFRILLLLLLIQRRTG